MRVIVFFDLPVGTAAERNAANKFRKSLVKDGFVMMQESVYCRLALNPTSANSIMAAVREYRPGKGMVQMLLVTEKQFSRMEYILGDCQSEIIENEDRLVIL